MTGDFGMAEHARDDWSGGESGGTQPAVWEGDSVPTTAGDTLAETQVLARVPALDTAEGGTGAVASKPDGRLLSQGLSTKLLLAAGVLIVLVATVPYLFNRGGNSKPGSPAPDADEAPRFSGDATSPGAVQTHSPTMNYQQEIPTLPAWAVDAPQGTGGGSSQATTLDGRIQTSPGANPSPTSPPGWRNQQPAPTWQNPSEVPRVSRTPPWNDQSSTSSPMHTLATQAPTSSPWPNPSRSVSPNTSRNLIPSSARTQSPSHYRSYHESRAGANRGMTLGRHVATVPTEYRGNYRPESRPESRPAGQATFPLATYGGRPAEPGVARLEGIIEKPSFRTTDDRAR